MNYKSRIIVSIVALGMVGACFLLLTPSEAQEPPPQPPPNVLTPLDIPDWEDPLLPDDGTILRSRPVAVNFDVLALTRPPVPGADPRSVPIRFSLFDDVTITVIFHRAKPRYSKEIPENPFELLGQEIQPVGYTWHGRLVGNEHEGHVVMVTDLGICLANVHIAGVGSFKTARSKARNTPSARSERSRRQSVALSRRKTPPARAPDLRAAEVAASLSHTLANKAPRST